MPDVDNKPKEIQQTAVDFNYNMRDNFNREKWKKFFEAYDRNDKNGMAKESHRVGVGPDRNKWIREMLEKSE